MNGITKLTNFVIPLSFNFKIKIDRELIKNILKILLISKREKFIIFVIDKKFK